MGAATGGDLSQRTLGKAPADVKSTAGSAGIQVEDSKAEGRAAPCREGRVGAERRTDDRDGAEGPSEATILLEAHRRGEAGALDRLVDLVYDDLRRIARSQLRKRAGRRELETTALVNEAYLRLIEGSGLVGSSRQHFLAVCARAMRFVLIDFARERIAQKRGGGHADATLEEDLLAPTAEEELANVLALHDALEEIGGSAPRLVQVVECRYFAGLSLEETAEVLGVSTRTVERDWRLARAHLRRILGGPGSNGSGETSR